MKNARNLGLIAQNRRESGAKTSSLAPALGGPSCQNGTEERRLQGPPSLCVLERRTLRLLREGRAFFPRRPLVELRADLPRRVVNARTIRERSAVSSQISRAPFRECVAVPNRHDREVIDARALERVRHGRKERRMSSCVVPSLQAGVRVMEDVVRDSRRLRTTVVTEETIVAASRCCALRRASPAASGSQSSIDRAALLHGFGQALEESIRTRPVSWSPTSASTPLLLAFEQQHFATGHCLM